MLTYSCICLAYISKSAAHTLAHHQQGTICHCCTYTNAQKQQQNTPEQAKCIGVYTEYLNLQTSVGTANPVAMTVSQTLADYTVATFSASVQQD